MKALLHRILVMGLALFLIAPSMRTYGKDQVARLTLNQAIKEGITNNRLIREAEEQERVAIQLEKKARADFFPKLSTSYTYSRLRNNPYTYFTTQKPVPQTSKITVGPKDNFTWDFDITQPLFTGFALTTKRRLAALDIDLKQVVKQQAILDVIKKVKVAYLNILLAKRALEVADEEVNQLEAHVHDAKQLHKQGVIPYNDLLKSQVALAQARQNRVKALSNLDVAIAALNSLLDRPITTKTQVMELPPFSPSYYELSSLLEKAIRDRPELKQLEIAIKQADMAVRLAKSAYYPQVFLNGRYERKGDNWQASENDYNNDHNTIVSLQLTWSLFEWGKRRADVCAALHKKKALLEKIEGIKESIMLEVKQAYQDLKVAQENIHTAIEALEQAKENYRITDLQYKEGITTSTEVLDARAFLTQAEFNYHRALYGYRIAKAELERAIGTEGDLANAKF